MNVSRAALIAGAIFGAAGVMLGAFGAHALRATLDERALAIWHTGVEYQFWHALALLAVGVFARDRASRLLVAAVMLFGGGIVLFSGSLYLLALGATHAIGIITPIGGVALIGGWIALAWSVWR